MVLAHYLYILFINVKKMVWLIRNDFSKFYTLPMWFYRFNSYLMKNFWLEGPQNHIVIGTRTF